MTRLEVNPGEIALPPVGVIRGAYGSFGAKLKPHGAESRNAGIAPSKPPRKRPCCKTCDGRGCVGHCKF